MKKILALVLSLVAVMTACFGLTACGKEDNQEKIVDVRTKTITVAYTDYAPMNYKDDNGVLVGFDTELALTIFNALGYEVKFKLIDWNNKYLELEAGTIDCIWNGFTCNVADDDGVQRSEKVAFTIPYMNNAQCIIRKADGSNLTSFDQFANKSIAYETGSAGQSFVESNIKANINKKGVASQMEAIRAVNLGTADYAVVDLLLAQATVGKGSYTNLAINEGIEIENEYYAIGFRKTDTKLVEKVNLMLYVYGELGYNTELAQKYGLENALLIKGE